MSSLLTVFGTLTFPAGGAVRWRRARLAIEERESDQPATSPFDAGNDLASVASVVADVADCWPFMRIVRAGEAVAIRGAMGDDDWCRWCGRLRALFEAAARLGGSGQIEVEEDGTFVGRLAIRGEQVVFEPWSRRNATPTHYRGEAEMRQLLADALEAELPVKKTAAKKVAVKKQKAKKVVVKKPAAKKVAVKEQTAANTSVKRAAVKKQQPGRS